MATERLPGELGGGELADAEGAGEAGEGLVQGVGHGQRWEEGWGRLKARAGAPAWEGGPPESGAGRLHHNLAPLGFGTPFW